MTVREGRSLEQLKWWIDNVQKETTYLSLARKRICASLSTDASFTGWGASAIVNNGTERATSGHLSKTEIESKNINYLEMKAALYALRALCHQCSDAKISLKVDNTAAVGAIRNMGSRSPLCDGVIEEIWQWAQERNVWILVSHIPGVENVKADAASRIRHNDELEWALAPTMFHHAMEKLKWTPNIDLFASRLNYKVKPFYSMRPDPEAAGCDAFTIDWQEHRFYAFPPFPLIQRVLRKIGEEGATGVIVVPNWPTKPWYPLLMSMIVSERCFLPRSPRTLQHPRTGEPHPMAKTMQMMVCVVSGSNSTTGA